LGAPPEVKNAWRDVEQLRKAVDKNNNTKKSIAKRLRHNERQAEGMRQELATKITGEDRIQLMELQYRIGKLELENMELEQSKIVHDSLMKGKDLTIMKLRLQLQVRDKIIESQRSVLKSNGLDSNVSYSRLALLEQEGVAVSFDTIRGAPRKAGNGNHAEMMGNGNPVTAAGRLGFGPTSSQSGRAMSQQRQLSPVLEPKASPIQYDEEKSGDVSFEDDGEQMRKAERQRRRRRRHKESFDPGEGSEESTSSFHAPSAHNSPIPHHPHNGGGVGIPVPQKVRKRSIHRRPHGDHSGVGNRRRNRRGGNTKMAEDVSQRGYRQLSMKKLPNLKGGERQVDGLYVPGAGFQPQLGNNPVQQGSDPSLGNFPDFQRSPAARKIGAKKALGRLNQKKMIVKQPPRGERYDNGGLSKTPTDPILESQTPDRIERGKARLSFPDVQSSLMDENNPG